MQIQPKRYKKCIALAIMLVAIAYNSYAFAQEAINRILASVAGEPVTYYDVLVAMHPQLQEAGLRITDKKDIRIKRLEETVLNDIINSILIRQEAKKYNVIITEQDLDAEMRKIARDNNTSIDVLEQQLRMQGTNIDSFKKNLKNNLLQQRIIGTFVFRKIIVSTQEVEEYYKKHIHDFVTDAIYTIYFVASEDKSTAEGIVKRLRSSKGITFASLEKAYGALQSGELENLVFSELSSEWQEGIGDAKEGDVIGPLHIENKYFVLYLKKKQEGKPLPFEDVYTTIEGKVRDSKFSSQYAEFIKHLRSKADIKVYQ